MRRYASRAAIAATLLVATTIAWQLNRPTNVFAQVAGAMSRARGFRCDLVMVTPGYNDTENAELIGRVSWIPSGEERVDHIQDGEPEFEPHLPARPQRPPPRAQRSKQFQIIPKSAAREFSFGLFGGLGDYSGKAEPIPGSKEIRGVKAEGFTVPWPTVVGDDTHANAKVQVWIDRATTLPVRVDLLGMDPRGSAVLRFEDFRWGPQDPALFDASAPAGYAEDADQRRQGRRDHPVRHGRPLHLRQVQQRQVPRREVRLRRRAGRSPPQAHGHAARRASAGPRAKTSSGATPRKANSPTGPTASPGSTSSSADFAEGVYNGKTVTPKDATKVLVRWQLDDGDYRVIFGDLSSATVSPSRLRQLESR